MANPGPASSTFANYVMVPQNEYRLLGVLKSLNLGAAADTAFPCITASGGILPAQIVAANGLISGASGNVAAATVGVYTAPSQGGSTVLTTAAITGVTGSTAAKITAATNPSTILAGVTTFYANVGTTVANGTCDLYVYGYDVS